MPRIRSMLLPIACVLATLAAVPAGAQVTLYEHPRYGGDSQTLDHDMTNLAGTRIGDNRVSSVRLAPGCSVVLYEHPNYRGEDTVLTNNLDRLAGTEVGDDQVSSVQVRCRPAAGQGIVLYTDPEYGGREGVFYEDVADLDADTFPEDAASSLRVPPGCTVTLYEHSSYRGASSTFYEDDPLLANDRVDDNRVSSLRVRCGGVAGGPPERPVPPPVGGDEYRCEDRSEDIAFQLDDRRNQAFLLLRGVEVARFHVTTESGGAMVLRPLGGARGEVVIVPRTREIQVRLNRTARPFCSYR